MKLEPRPESRSDRRARAQRIAGRLLASLGDRVLAIAAYGSTGRGMDRPYSDLEMLCVVPGARDVEYLFCCEDGLKTSVDLMSPEEILESVRRVEEDWPITGSEYTRVAPFHDPSGFWPKVEDEQLQLPDAAFARALRGVMLGYFFEYLGKLRNERDVHRFESFASIAVEVAWCGVWLMGLRHRHLYQSTATQFSECFGLEDRPDGLDDHLRLVMSGDLHDPWRVLDSVERFWIGAVDWCEANGIPLETSVECELDDLVKRTGIRSFGK